MKSFCKFAPELFSIKSIYKHTMAKEKSKKERDRFDKDSETVSSYAIDDMSKGNIWSYDVEDIYRMLAEVMMSDRYKENKVHYHNIIRPVFDIQMIKRENDELVASLEAQNFQIFSTPDYEGTNAIAIRKRQIKKVTDLTLENIFHLTPREVLYLINENMGTGWQGLPLAIQDIIQAAFYVDCSVMPAAAMRRPGGLIDRRKEDGYEVLEIERGSWVEAVFLKVKPKMEKLHFEILVDGKSKSQRDDLDDDDDDDDDDDNLPDDNDNDSDYDMDEPDEAEATIEDIDAIDESTEDDDE